VPPHNHRANPAERAIQTAKNHLIAALCGTHVNFPANLWDKLLPQVELTMNILRPFAGDRSISAYEGVCHSKYDFLAHPLAPCGTLVLVHDPPETRGSFASHGSLGYYLGPALKHHRCFRVYVIDTQSERVSDSLAWFPAPLILPGSRPPELNCTSLDSLAAALTAVADSTDMAEPLRRLTASAADIIRQASDVLFVPGTVVAEEIMLAPVDAAHTAGQQRVTCEDAPRPPLDIGAPPPPILPSTVAPVVVLASLPLDSPGAEQRVAQEEPVERTPTTNPQRAQRRAGKPKRYQQLAHMVATDVNRVAYKELEAVVDAFLQSDPPLAEPQALLTSSWPWT
jgi:hypothetical protein